MCLCCCCSIVFRILREHYEERPEHCLGLRQIRHIGSIYVKSR
jgi:hypothetical protein